jgi:prepilin-type N-terminal cleavage/methylation domain-containing protein
MHSGIISPFSLRRTSSAFTLIELLVVIAIISILAIVVVLVLNPGQLLAQARDSSRLQDLSSLQSALGYYVTDASINGSVSIGAPLTVYVSLPDQSATSSQGDQCQGLGLPSLPTPYTYHCSASSTSRLVDGSGWIPVNMKALTQGPPLGSLPIDPVNTSSSRSYYTYTTDGRQYETTAALESQKYKLGGPNDLVGNDGGTLATVLERGTKLGLEPLDYGDPSLVGYWTFDEGAGSIAYDYSGNNATGSWNGTPAGTSGYYSAGKVGQYAGTFNGSNNIVTSTVSQISAIANAANSASFWMQWNGSSSVVVFNLGLLNYYINTNTCTGINNGGSVWGTNSPPSNQWVFITLVLYNGTYNANGSGLYVNGLPLSLSACAGGSFSGNANPSVILGAYRTGPAFYYTGLIDDVRIYNRALSASEIAAMYNGGK